MVSTISPRVRPKVLLWTLLLCNVGTTVFMFVYSQGLAREASELNRREPEMVRKTEKAKSEAQSSTDIEKLRSIAIESYDAKFEDWREGSRRRQLFSETIVWCSLFTAAISVVLGGVLYGLRTPKNASAGQQTKS